MDYNNLFKNGSLKFIPEFIGKVVYDGFGMEKGKGSEQIVMLVSCLVAVFLLYKLVWLVWKVMRFILGCLEW
ncbi:MAG: hypothetical protein MRERV_14c051 [Mycoplasmataceae bacterium RV_VA103A]|nr:MAG: hypothetical protein MRERV_14c051 [Mycoplasmataceae bacterium RV_VA103A]